MGKDKKESVKRLKKLQGGWLIYMPFEIRILAMPIRQMEPLSANLMKLLNMNQRRTS